MRRLSRRAVWASSLALLIVLSTFGTAQAHVISSINGPFSRTPTVITGEPQVVGESTTPVEVPDEARLHHDYDEPFEYAFGEYADRLAAIHARLETKIEEMHSAGYNVTEERILLDEAEASRLEAENSPQESFSQLREVRSMLKDIVHSLQALKQGNEEFAD